MHLHGLLLGRVRRCGADGEPVFIEVGSPTDDEVHALLHTLIARLMKMLTRRGVVVEDMGAGRAPRAVGARAVTGHRAALATGCSRPPPIILRLHLAARCPTP
jgi:hypothetical protein